MLRQRQGQPLNGSCSTGRNHRQKQAHVKDGEVGGAEDVAPLAKVVAVAVQDPAWGGAGQGGRAMLQEGALNSGLREVGSS